jgi:multiple sugar transport system substrate-binding protein
MWRAIASIAAAAAGVLFAAGCTPAAAGGEALPTNGIGPITFAIGQDDIGMWLPPLIARWNKQNPGQQVTVLYLPEVANDQLEQLVANLQAKSDEYDVIDMDVVWTADFASNGWIIPLPASKFPLQDFLQPAVNTAMYQGKLWAVPDYSNADLLYYRKDILAKAGIKQPPTTWKQLEYLAATVAPKYHLNGYAGTFAQYEGLTVNFAEAVQSAGGSILNKAGTTVTLDTPQALAGLTFLVDGFKQGWIPSQALRYEEVSAQDAFEDGQYLFLNDWPDVWATLGSDKTEKYGFVALPGLDGPGSSSLGGANLAISAYSQHQQTALRFIQYMTQRQQQEAMLSQGSFPPVLKQLYTDKSLDAEFPYLTTLEEAINDAQPRPAITNYDQASLVISSEAYQALEGNKSPRVALQDMQAELTQIIRDGLATQAP